MTDKALLADHVDLLTGFPFKSAAYSQGSDDVRLLRGDNVVQGALRWDNAARWPRRHILDVKQYELRPGDVVLAMDRPWIEAGLKYARIGDLDVPSLLVQRVARLRARAQVDQGFLFYLIGSRAFTEHVLAVQTGTAVPHISGKQILSFEFTLPTIDEQRAIASVLGALDDKIEQNRRIARALEELARATFKAWFVDFEPVRAKAAGATSFPGMPAAAFAALPDGLTDSAIGPVPQGWDVIPLSKLCKLVSGGTPKRSNADYWGGDIPWYSVKDAPSDGMPWVYFTEEQITESGLGESAANLVPVGCTIVSARGTVGRIALTGRPMTFNQSCYGLLPADGASYRHLNLLVREIVTELQQRTHGSVFDTITRQTFDDVSVVRPPSVLLEKFEDVVAPSFDLPLASLKESQKLAELRDYLLPRLLSGSVRMEVRRG